MVQPNYDRVSRLLDFASKEMQELITDIITKLYRKAKATKNPVDDALVYFLALVLKIDLNPEA